MRSTIVSWSSAQNPVTASGPRREGRDVRVLGLGAKESVEHHADDEEDDFFPAAEKEFDEARLEELGAEMEVLKGRLIRGAAPRRRSAGRRDART